MTELAGKVVIVTGASRGIGEAAAVELASAGASVMLTARDGARAAEVARRISDAGGKAVSAACDVAEYGAVERLVRETRDRLGSVDVLVNNAGVIEPIAMIAEADPAEWARGVQINLAGAFNAVRGVLPAMLAAGRAGLIQRVIDSHRIVSYVSQASLRAAAWRRGNPRWLLACERDGSPRRCAARDDEGESI